MPGRHVTCRAPRRRSLAAWKRLLPAAALLLFLGLLGWQTVAAQNVSDEIQLRREKMELEKARFLAEQAKVNDINARVKHYRELRASIPFLSIPGTTNIIRVYINNHDLKKTARQLFDLTDGANDETFEKGYWSTVKWLNQAEEYRYGAPEYGALDAEDPDENLAIFPNIRKSGLKAVVAKLTSEDSTLARQFTTHAVRAYRRRLREEVERLVLEVGEPPDVTGPNSLSGETRFALFTKVISETRETLPPRELDETSIFINTERPDVVVNSEAVLERTPVAFSLREGVNMLAENYAGYDVDYQPGRVVFSPEGGPMAFFGGRTTSGKARTQLGLYFSFSQTLDNLFVLNQTAFAAFASDEAPPVNGGLVNGGLHFDLGYFSVTGLVGLAAFNVLD